MIERLKCGNCHKLVKYKDPVYLDMLNTVIHQRCYKIEMETKDRGIFTDIINKYSFFSELKQN